LLQQQLSKVSLEDLIAWSGQPAFLPKVAFGKHRGAKWTDVPDSYLD
jgi:exodeoxyribonuclease X